MSPLKLARLSLSRHLFTTSITVLAIALSVACGGLLLRLHNLSQSRFSAMGEGGDAIVGAKSGGIEILLNSLNGEGEYPDFLPYKLFESLKAEQSVQHGDGVVTRPSYIQSITPLVYFGKYYQHRIVGTDHSFFQRKQKGKSLTFKEGNLFQAEGEVVIGPTIAKKYNLKVGDQIQFQPWLSKNTLASKETLKVSGILNPTQTHWDQTLFSSIEQAHQVFEKNQAAIRDTSIWGPQVLNYFLIDVNSNSYDQLEALINKRTVGQIIKVQEQKQKLQDLSGAGKNIGLMITSFVLLLGGLSVCSMLIVRFEGMSQQIAILRALGYTKKELAMWLLWTSLLLGLTGVLIGATLDALTFPLLRQLLESALPPKDLIQSHITESTIIWLVALIAITSSVIIPILKITRYNTHDSLS